MGQILRWCHKLQHQIGKQRMARYCVRVPSQQSFEREPVFCECGREQAVDVHPESVRSDIGRRCGQREAFLLFQLGKLRFAPGHRVHDDGSDACRTRGRFLRSPPSKDLRPTLSRSRLRCNHLPSHAICRQHHPSKNLEVGLMRPAGMMLPANCVRGQVVATQAGSTESGSKIFGRRGSEKSPPRSASVGTVVVNTVPWRKPKLSQLKKKKSFSLTAAPPNVAPY